MRRCEIHAENLQSDSVEVRRGLPPAPPEGYREAETDFFPYANSWIMGGCVILVGVDEPGDREQVEFCPQCRIAQRSWFEGRQSEEFWRPE